MEKKEEVSRYHIFTTRFYILCIYAWLLKEWIQFKMALIKAV